MGWQRGSPVGLTRCGHWDGSLRERHRLITRVSDDLLAQGQLPLGALGALHSHLYFWPQQPLQLVPGPQTPLLSGKFCSPGSRPVVLAGLLPPAGNRPIPPHPWASLDGRKHTCTWPLVQKLAWNMSSGHWLQREVLRPGTSLEQTDEAEKRLELAPAQPGSASAPVKTRWKSSESCFQARGVGVGSHLELGQSV